MSRRPEPLIDDENPEWTEKDFAEAKPGHALAPDILAAFPRTPRASGEGRKIPVSLALSEDVLQHFQAEGPDWETRIDDVLRRAIRG